MLELDDLVILKGGDSKMVGKIKTISYSVHYITADDDAEYGVAWGRSQPDIYWYTEDQLIKVEEGPGKCTCGSDKCKHPAHSPWCDSLVSNIRKVE